MKRWIAFWNILAKDMRSYYLKPPNVSWGIIFPLAWTGMFFIRSGSGLESVLGLLPGVMTISVLFGTTSMSLFRENVRVYCSAIMSVYHLGKLIYITHCVWL